MKKRNAIMLADTRPALVGTVLVQLEETSPELFDEAIIYYQEEISQQDRELMTSIIPCRFVYYTPPLPDYLFEKSRFKRFSALMFCRYEMFEYLSEFETVTWLDTDILIQRDLTDMINAAKKTGAAFIREDPINKTAANPDYMRTCFSRDIPEYKMDTYLYCSGTVVLSKKILEEQKIDGKVCTDWCYQKTIQWADILDLPDQGVLNAAIQHFSIKVFPLKGKDYCCYPSLGRNCDAAAIIHAWGSNKFWNDWYIYSNFQGWKNYYEKWKNIGGTSLNFEIQPDISIVIPSYKPNISLFKQALDSLMNQTRDGWERYSDFEIIIVAEPFNESELRELVDSYSDRRIRLEFNEQRLGIAASLNRGMRLAKGKYVARMDDDDVCHKARLFLQATYLDENPNIILCTTDFQYFGDMNEWRMSFEDEMSFAWSLFTCPFDHPTIMFRKEFFFENGLFYDEKRGYVEDWELWRRAFKKGMTVGCIHKVLLYHRWINNSSAGQSNKTVDMMRELVQKNFAELNVSIPTDDLWMIGPWNGRLDNEEDICKLQGYFQLALENNEKLKIYDQECLIKVFQLRLSEAKTGILPGLSRRVENENSILNIWSDSNLPGTEIQVPKRKNVFFRFLKRILKPLYRPFRWRYEERLISIQDSVWNVGGHALNCITKLDDIIEHQEQQMSALTKKLDDIIVYQEQQINILTQGLKELYEESAKVQSLMIKEQGLSKKFEDMNGKLETIYNALVQNRDEIHRHLDFSYRDIMIALERQKTYLPEMGIRLITEYPIAYQSLDHLYPHGTIRDNTRYPRFIEKCEELLKPYDTLAFLDLGCSGGGMVLEAALRGHISIGLEGSDCSKKEQRAEWRLLGNRLQTCDITKPFKLENSKGGTYRFNIITAWEVLEHIAEDDIPQLMENIRNHLAARGYFVASIANWDDIDPVSGVNWHVTCHPYGWWKDKFESSGFTVCSELFAPIDLARGGYNPPHCYEAPYSDIDETRTFHIVVQNNSYERD